MSTEGHEKLHTMKVRIASFHTRPTKGASSSTPRRTTVLSIMTNQSSNTGQNLVICSTIWMSTSSRLNKSEIITQSIASALTYSCIRTCTNVPSTFLAFMSTKVLRLIRALRLIGSCRDWIFRLDQPYFRTRLIFI